LDYNIIKDNNIIPGIYILSKSITINEKECLIISLEGIDKYNDNLCFHNQLRNIILILSSLVIYEGNDNLELTKTNFNNIFKNIKLIKSSNSKKDLTKDYMCKLLCEINLTNEDDTNSNKFNNDVINKKIFKQFDLITKYNVSQKALNYKLKWIKDNFDIKRLNKIELNGIMICDIMENLIEKFNIEETPIIDGILESIIFSQMNEIAEGIIKQFKNKLKNYINENQNQSLNYYDLMSFFFNFQKEEGVSTLFKTKVAQLISFPNSEIYIQKIIKLTLEEIEIYYKSQKTKYDELINNFGSKANSKNELKTIQEINEYLNNLLKYLKKNFIPIISYKMFNFNHLLNNKVNKYIINKISFIKDNINAVFENENNRIIDKNNCKTIEFENSIRDMKNKEREYLTAIKIEKEKYKNLEKYIETFENENQKKLNDSEMKLNELIKENSILKNKKLIISEDCSINGVKNDFVFVKNKLNVYKTNIENICNQIIINNQSNKIEEGIKLLNTKFDDWLSKFEQMILNNFNNYGEKIDNYKKDLENVNFEITKLKIELAKEQQNNIMLNNQIKNKIEKLEELQKLLNDKNELIKIKEERINLQMNSIENYKNNIEKLELSLNKNMSKYQSQKEEIDGLKSLIKSILSKKKDKYEHYIKQLSDNIKQDFEHLNKKYNFFK
jgi:hypothetical protein